MFGYIKETNFYILQRSYRKENIGKLLSILSTSITSTCWNLNLVGIFFPFPSKQTDLVEIEGCFLSAGADANYNEGTAIWRRQMEKAGK